MSISRRKFIQLGSLASASFMVPGFIKACNQLPKGSRNKILVVLQLSGGNDGLNTVIPYRNDLYYKARPVLGIKKPEVLTLTDEVGLHPSLNGLKGLFDEGNVSIVNNVGYENPNRSHFRSMDIWQSASREDEILSTGWLGRYMEVACQNCDDRNTFAVEIDDTLSLAMKGKERSALAFSNVNKLHKAVSDSFLKKAADSHQDEHDAKLATYLYKTLRETTTAAEYVYEQTNTYKSTATYPNTILGKRMQLIADLINSKAETRVYYVSHGSFDTHVNQMNRQKSLFNQLDQALTAFTADLKKNGNFDDVVIMTFSEFGRRVAQNASNGTDHGTANSMFLISGSLKKAGLYNPLPDLQNLDEGDLKYQIDFKSVYATILNNWMEANPAKALNNNYDLLNMI